MEDNRAEKIAEQIREFVENVDHPEKWEVVIPRNEFNDVKNRLDTEFDQGSYLNGVQISYTEPYMDDWDETTVKYKSALSEHINT